MEKSLKMSWEYIAGFVDGEGSIVKMGETDFRILIPQTHEGVLLEIKEFVQAGFIFQAKTRKAHWKDNWVFVIAKQKDVLSFLEHIQEYLIVKKSSAQKHIPLLRSIVKDRGIKAKALQRLIKTCKLLRSQGLTYRGIAKRVQRDFGYVRRLVLR